MIQDAIIALFIAFVISAISGPVLIPVLHRLKFGQTERSDGPQSHLKKNGTPTMGGIMFLLGIVLSSLCFAWKYPQLIPVLFATIGFGIIGFLDDYLKIVMRRSDGLYPKQKMLGQLIVAGIFTYYCMTRIGTELIIPFTGGKTVDIKWLYIVFCPFVMIATDNGVNFSDGLDGLCSSVTVMVSTFFAVVALGAANGVSVLCTAVTGGLMGFLLFNVHPAKIFMGDTGSLALGGFVAAVACVLKMPLFILLVGLIYVIEVLSVMIQVAYFKKTGGKRFFKMAPIHHHFELSGYSETQIVAIFSIVTAILCLVSYLAL